MKKNSICLVFLVACWNILFSQETEFEGVIVYNIEVKSRIPGLSDHSMKKLLGLGEQQTVFVKKGNYKQSVSIGDSYYITGDQKLYMKFNFTDTLYTMDYKSDTTQVIDIKKIEVQKKIAGYACKSIVIKTNSGNTTYFYAPDLYMNPEYDKNNKINQQDVYSKETESVCLSFSRETEQYNLIMTCTRVEKKKIDDTVFDLPRLPQREFSIEAIEKAPEYKRGGGWKKYLLANLNKSIAVKYLKIPKGENTARQTAWVGFIVSENGEVLNVNIINKKEVHPKLAEEATRIVFESGSWKPGTRYGQKISYTMKQPITFEVTKE